MSESLAFKSPMSCWNSCNNKKGGGANFLLHEQDYSVKYKAQTAKESPISSNIDEK